MQCQMQETHWTQNIKFGPKWVENRPFGPKQRPNESYSPSGPIQTTPEAKNGKKTDFLMKTASDGPRRPPFHRRPEKDKGLAIITARGLS